MKWNTSEKLLYIQCRTEEVANGLQLFVLLKKEDIFLSSVETKFYVNFKVFWPKNAHFINIKMLKIHN
jgi:hypothetical protein